ncbi:MAG: HD domain-containing protein [Candidatus Harrisonbacteria bacterium]|nr:HD domain-containing protein [Candidatus Harrisonbacteria bacterium]
MPGKVLLEKVPKEVLAIAITLIEAGYEGYLVGGCVRDLLLELEPRDWDVTTNATPEKIQELFPESFYENQYGTVGVKTGAEDPRWQIVEVTTYRRESGYSDSRRPDTVEFVKNIEEDLARRDFTINAIALSPKGEVIDPYQGMTDLEAKVIRTVGDAEERFNEDALRLLRGVRLMTELQFLIESKTLSAMRRMVEKLKEVAAERIRDEFIRIIMAEAAPYGIRALTETRLIKYVLPELLETVGCGQNKHHIYDVYEHTLRVLQYAAENNFSLEVRLAALFHDIGKPRTKRGEGEESTFYNHEVVGERMVKTALTRLKFSKKVVDMVAHLVRHHMFYYNTGEVSEAGVRRFMKKVGAENIDDLLHLREADRIGSGVPKAVPYKLRHLLYMIEKVKQDPIEPKMLKVDGTMLMKELTMEAGPRLGWILSALLDEVLDDPKRNEAEYLLGRAKEIQTETDEELMARAKKAKEHKGDLTEERDRETRKKFFVK